ncbi:synaptogyrin-3 isoform X2 [Cricetulus griseus]|uniref:Synaptogyrin-3 isoform X2 n=1 Tax=Cricetulus griseus TaxID=10029 RepID=A0A9J7K0Q2_CRIGR|nr:synaptogyrin-3 isoform X2 [Cricetulus griseus]
MQEGGEMGSVLQGNSRTAWTLGLLTGATDALGSGIRRPDSPKLDLLPAGVLYSRVRAHSQRGLRECGQRSRAALRLQRKRGRLSLRHRAGSRGLHRLRGLPAAGRALSADQQRPRPPPRSAAGPGLLRGLVLPVVRRLLFPHQSVAAHSARARHGAGWGCGTGRHRVQLLLHSQLGGAHREGPAAVPPGHRYVSLRHRSARCRGCPGLPRLPSGQWCGGHRNIPEPALHRNPGHQPQRVPGACLLVVVRLRPGLEGHLTIVGLKAFWTFPGSCRPSAKDKEGGCCGPLGPRGVASLGRLDCPNNVSPS